MSLQPFNFRFKGLRAGLFLAICLLIAPSQAATIYWDGISGSWNIAANWSTASGATTPDPLAVPGTLDDVIFNITTANGAETVALDADQSANSLTFNNTGTTALTGGGTSRTLTLGAGGITVNAGAGAVTIGSATAGQEVNIALGAAETWNIATKLTADNAISGGYGIIKSGSGTLVLNGTNTYNGGTTINAGMLQFGKTASMPASGTVAVNAATLAVNVGGSGEFTATELANLLAGTGGGGAPVTYAATSSIGIDTTNAGSPVTLTSAFATTGSGTVKAGLVKLGTGTLALNGGGTYIGGGAASSPFAVRRGTLLLGGGTHAVTGEAVIGGTFTTANGSAGYDATLQIDAGALNISSWLSVGKGNGTGTVSSDLIANNGATISAANISAGYNAGSSLNLPKGTITLNNTSTITVTGNGLFNFAESTGSNFTMTLNDSAKLLATGTGAKSIGQNGTGKLILNGTSSIDFGYTGAGTRTYVGINNGIGELTLNGTSTVKVGALCIGYGTSNTQTANGTVTINSGTTLSTEGDVLMGFAGSATEQAKLHLAGGTLNVATATKRWMIVGQYDYTNSTVTVDAGSNLNLNANTDIQFKTGGNGYGTNVFDMNGGNVTSFSDNALTANGSGVVNLMNSGGNTANNTFNLNGGTLAIRRVMSGSNVGTRTFNFNGGTLKPTASNTSFFDLNTGTAYANVRNGGAVINTSGFDVTIVQPLIHSNVTGDLAIDGGLNKQGSGILTLPTVNTYTGPTNVSGGTLTLGASADINTSSGITVNGGKLLQTSSTAISPVVTLTNGTVDGTGNIGTLNVAASLANHIANGNVSTTPLTINDLTFNGAATLDLFPASQYSPALYTTNLMASGTGANRVVINATAASWAPGENYLISYSSLTGGSANFLKGTITGLSGRQSATLDFTSTPNVITLNIAGDNPVWTGALNGDWTTATLASPKNWKLITSSTPTDYINNDIVLFDDSVGTGTTTVSISSANVSPKSVAFNNSFYNYTINGPYGIVDGSSPATLTKSGYAAVTLAGVNTYSGGTSVSGGTLNINNASAIGTGTLTLDNSATSVAITLDNTSGTAVALTTANPQIWNCDFTFTGANDLNMGTGAVTMNAGRTITVGGSTLTVGGAISGTGFGLTKAGPGTLKLGGANTFDGAIVVTNGTLEITGSVTGTVADQVGTGYEDAKLIISSGGSFTANYNGGQPWNSSIDAGAAATTAGSIQISGSSSSFTANRQMTLGNQGYGAFSQSAGTTTMGGFLAIGGNNVAGGILNQSGGTFTVTSAPITVGFLNTSGLGVLNLSNNAVFNANGPAGAGVAGGGVWIGEFGTGILNVADNAALTIANGGAGGGLQLGINTGSNGTVNLFGGTVTTPFVNKGTGIGTINFNGGTLKANAASATFMAGLDNAYVYSGGAVIDDGGNAITIAQPLVAATGGGVTATGLTFSGSGYVDTPIVQVYGDGTGATAVANIDASGYLTGITITNPGVGYSYAYFGLLGGGNYNTGTISGSPDIVANIGGGLTKHGIGTTTLTGENTFTGPTTVNAGALLLGGSGSINGSSGITIDGAGAKLVQSSTVAVTPTVIVTNGTLDGTATVDTVTVGSGTGAIITHGNGGLAPLTIGSLNFTGAAEISVKTISTTPTAPGIITTSLTTGGGPITVNAASDSWNSGTVYDLVSYSSMTGVLGDYLKGTITGLTQRQSATLVNPAGFIALSIAGDSPVWTGANSGNWTTAVIPAPKNWKLIAGGTSTDFLAGDIVLFNDSAVGTTSVNISDASVDTTSVTFNNSSKSYSISSAGGFGIASGYLVKSGSGSLTINTANTYAGGTTLNAGTLNVNNTSALGTGALAITGGTLDNTSTAAITLSTNNVLNVNGDFAFTGTKDLNLGTGDVTLGGALGSRSITVAGGNLIVGSIPVATAGYGLTKAGPGTLSLSGATANRLDGTLSVTGTLETSQDLYVTGLAGNGVIQPLLNANKWFFVTNDSDYTFSGAIQDGAGLLGLSKNGPGKLTLTGSNNYSLATNVNQGTLVFSGTTNNTNQGETVGSTAGMNGVLIISPAASFGANRNVDQFSSSITVGGNATSAGSIQLSPTGAFNVAQQFGLGTGTGGYAAYTQNGGIATIGSFMVVGFNNDRSVANIRDGSLTIGSNLISVGAGGTGSIGVMNLTGGTVTSTATTGYSLTIGGIFVGENGTGVLNVSGGSLNLSGWGLRIAPNTGSTGTVNLLGGTVNTNSVSKGSGTGELNFNGGTLKASAVNATFLEGLTNTYIYDGGAKIDDSGYEITVAQPLLAPTGNGVSATGLTVSGGGFIDTPIVQITGDGTGASAVANIDAGGNLISITMTNPGIGYSYASFALLGGGVGNTGAIGGTPTIVANVSGGLTKMGTGTLTLTGELSYTGDTAVNAGTLTIAGTGILNTPSAKVTVFDGGTLNAASIVCDTLTIGGTPPPSSAASFTNANSVPEPSTIAMLILAGISLIGWTVRRCR